VLKVVKLIILPLFFCAFFYSADHEQFEDCDPDFEKSSFFEKLFMLILGTSKES